MKVNGPNVKESGWLLRARKQSLTGGQKLRLRDILRYKFKTARASFSRRTFSKAVELKLFRSGPASFWTTGAHQTTGSRVEPS